MDVILLHPKMTECAHDPIGEDVIGETDVPFVGTHVIMFLS